MKECNMKLTNEDVEDVLDLYEQAKLKKCKFLEKDGTCSHDNCLCNPIKCGEYQP